MFTQASEHLRRLEEGYCFSPRNRISHKICSKSKILLSFYLYIHGPGADWGMFSKPRLYVYNFKFNNQWLKFKKWLCGKRVHRLRGYSGIVYCARCRKWTNNHARTN